MERQEHLSQAALDGLYHDHGRVFYNVALHYVWDQAEAKDLVHDAFHEVWRWRQELSDEVPRLAFFVPS